MNEDERIMMLVRYGTLAADSEVIALGPTASGAAMTATAVNTALRMLLDNGMIALRPQSEWPAFVELDRWKVQA